MKRHTGVLKPLTTFLLSGWWISFTFYSAIVVPIGTELFDPVQQGMITQRVTHWLNALTAAYIVAHLAEMISGPARRSQFVAWVLIVLSLAILLWLHPYLDRMIDTTDMKVIDGKHFYPGHRAYLWVSTVGWLAGGWLLLLRMRQREPAPDS